MATYVHAVVLPEMIEQMRIFEIPLETIGCVAQYRTPIAVQFVLYVGSELVMLCAFPIVFCERRKQMRIRQQTLSVVVVDTAEVSQRTAASRSTANTELPDKAVNRRPTQKRSGRPSNSSHGFLVMALLTCNVVICWTPATVSFLTAAFLNADFPTVFQVALTIFAMVPVLDPILLAVAMKDLRKALRELIPIRVSS